ncbi:MAG: hypothetical protein HQ522_02950 [Bacteroidetes bacterium]|nr:hypothetical protein [Bacteroidota bacterium]
MSFKAKLDIEGTEFNVTKASYTICRPVDEMGRITSSVVGGEITFELNSRENNMFFENICHSKKIAKGSISFNKRHEDAIMRKFEFKNAYVATFSETFDHSGHMGTMTMSVTLIAQEINMGEGELGNDYFSFALNR